jgi:hypothetical protein
MGNREIEKTCHGKSQKAIGNARLPRENSTNVQNAGNAKCQIPLKPPIQKMNQVLIMMKVQMNNQ